MIRHHFLDSLSTLPTDLLSIAEGYAWLDFKFTPIRLVRSHMCKKPRKRRGRPRKGWFEFDWHIEFGFAVCMEFFSPTLNIEFSSRVTCEKRMGVLVELGSKGYALRYIHDRSTRTPCERSWVKRLSKDPNDVFNYMLASSWNETDRRLPHVFTDSAVLCFYDTRDLELFTDWFETASNSGMLDLQLSGEFSENQFQITKIS
jgi:hypothetical protein